MKLTLAQKVSLVVCILWEATALLGFAGNPKSAAALIVSLILIPMAFLWMTGVLKPLLNWFKKTDQ